MTRRRVATIADPSALLFAGRHQFLRSARRPPLKTGWACSPQLPGRHTECRSTQSGSFASTSIASIRAAIKDTYGIPGSGRAERLASSSGDRHQCPRGPKMVPLAERSLRLETLVSVPRRVKVRTRSSGRRREGRKMRLSPLRGLRYTARFSLPADLDTGSSSAATTGTSAATVRNKLYPKCAFSAVVRGAAGTAQCIHAGLWRARGCAGVSR